MGFSARCPVIIFPANIKIKNKENKPIVVSLTPKQFDWKIIYQQKSACVFSKSNIFPIKNLIKKNIQTTWVFDYVVRKFNFKPT
jgi:hypothetical protein